MYSRLRARHKFCLGVSLNVSCIVYIGAPIRYVSNFRSAKMTAYPSRSMVDQLRWVGVNFDEANAIGRSDPAGCP